VDYALRWHDERVLGLARGATKRFSTKSTNFSTIQTKPQTLDTEVGGIIKLIFYNKQ
jgi:hypothetical protein